MAFNLIQCFAGISVGVGTAKLMAIIYLLNNYVVKI